MKTSIRILVIALAVCCNSVNGAVASPNTLTQSSSSGTSGVLPTGGTTGQVSSNKVIYGLDVETWVKIIITLLGSPVLLVVIKYLLDLYPPQRVARARRKGLKGQWGGKAHQVDNIDNKPLPPEFEISFDFNPGWRTVKGQFSFDSFDKKRGRITSNFNGKFLSDTLIQLEYKIKKKDAIGFGVMILRYYGSANDMEGEVIGTSSHYLYVFASRIIINKVLS